MAKQYNYVDMLKALAKDHTKCFKCKTYHGKDAIVYVDKVSESSWSIEWDRGKEDDGFSTTAFLWNQKYELIENPVDFMTALKAFENDKTIRCERNGVTTTHNKMYGSTFISAAMLHGTWYIED